MPPGSFEQTKKERFRLLVARFEEPGFRENRPRVRNHGTRLRGFIAGDDLHRQQTTAAAAFLVSTIYAPEFAIAPLMVALGVGLNGTSSSLYATVATLAPQSRRSRMYGFFYTTNESGAFTAPLVFGRLADIYGIRVSMVAMGLFTAAVLPISLALRPYLHPSPDEWDAASRKNP